MINETCPRYYGCTHCKWNGSCDGCMDAEVDFCAVATDNIVNIVEEETGKMIVAEEPVIKDSGDRTQFASGAVRDMRSGKGRCDLMPLEVVYSLIRERYDTDTSVIDSIGEFQISNDTSDLYSALETFSNCQYGDMATMLLEVAKHFEEGALKYGENNWQKGIPAYCYIDSAIRHYLKWLRGDDDEPHARAFVWNIMCCIWEVDYRDEEIEHEENENN